MNILILAAGYATRLYPLTLNKAKPLLEVAGKPMVEWVLDNLAPIQGIGTVYIVTNNKFAADFQAWADGYNAAQPRCVSRSSTTSPPATPTSSGRSATSISSSTKSTSKTTTCSSSRATTFSANPSPISPSSPRAATPCWRPTTWAIWRRSRSTTT